MPLREEPSRIQTLREEPSGIQTLREEPGGIQTLGCTWGQLYNFCQCFCYILALGHSTTGIRSLGNLAYTATAVCWRCCVCFAEFPRSAPDDGGVWSWGCVCATCGRLPGHAVGVWSRHWQVELYFYPGLHIVSVNVVPTLKGRRLLKQPFEMLHL